RHPRQLCLPWLHGDADDRGLLRRSTRSRRGATVRDGTPPARAAWPPARHRRRDGLSGLGGGCVGDRGCSRCRRRAGEHGPRPPQCVSYTGIASSPVLTQSLVDTTEKSRRGPSIPFSSCVPQSSKRSAEPATMSLTVSETST